MEMKKLIEQRIELLKTATQKQGMIFDLEVERQLQSYIELHLRMYGPTELLNEAAAETATPEETKPMIWGESKWGDGSVMG
jgi:hypothetical protein